MPSSRFPDGVLKSRPVDVHWAGWRTDTQQLQQGGWELAVEFDPCRMNYILVMRHQMMGLYATTYDCMIPQDFMDIGYRGEMPAFTVKHIAPRIMVQHQADITPITAFPIDAQPSFHPEFKMSSLEDLNIFTVPLTRTQEVLYDEANLEVVDHLQAIIDLQSDKQRELREKARRGPDPGSTWQPEMKVHAQLVSVA